MSVFEHHEVVNFVHDPATGLKAIIAIHSTSLGPAAGGCRRWQYAQDADALTDALRLSRGMTYKNATEEDGRRLVEHGILYAPDYVINAGGIISATREYLGQSSADEVREAIAGIPERLRTIFTEAKSADRPPDVVADEWAHRLVSAGTAECGPHAERKIT